MRGEGVSHGFSIPYGLYSFNNTRREQSKYNGMLRETAIAPAQWKAGGSLVYLRQTETLL